MYLDDFGPNPREFNESYKHMLQEMQTERAEAGAAWLGADRVEARKAELSFETYGVSRSIVGMSPPIHLTNADLMMSGDPARAAWDPVKTEYT